MALARYSGDCAPVTMTLRAENEAGHAVDAGFLGAVGVAFDAIDIGVAGKQPAHQIAVHAAIDGGLDQHFGVAQIGAFGEVELHQALLRSDPDRWRCATTG